MTVKPPNGLPQRTLNTGLEVDTADPAKPEIGYDAVLETFGKVLSLQVVEGTGAGKETVIYQVVVDRNTPVKAKR